MTLQAMGWIGATPHRDFGLYLFLAAFLAFFFAFFAFLAFFPAGFADAGPPATLAAATAFPTSSLPQPSSGVQVVWPWIFFAVVPSKLRMLLALSAGFALIIKAAAPATAGVAEEVPLKVFVKSPGS